MKVVDSEGKLGVLIFNGDYGGRVDVFGKDGNPRAGMLITEHGGSSPFWTKITKPVW